MPDKLAPNSSFHEHRGSFPNNADRIKSTASQKQSYPAEQLSGTAPRRGKVLQTQALEKVLRKGNASHLLQLLELSCQVDPDAFGARLEVFLLDDSQRRHAGGACCRATAIRVEILHPVGKGRCKLWLHYLKHETNMS